MQPAFKGIYPAITTKFSDDHSLDITAFLRNVDAQIDAGVHGLIIGGSLGEASTLTDPERLRLLKETRAHGGERIPVLLNIAESSTSRAISLVQEAGKAGADGFMVLPPLNYKAGPEEIVHFFKTIAGSTELPILIYNNPFDYKIGLTVEQFAEFEAIPNIVAVKESTRDITNVTRMKNAYGDRFKVLCGVDTLAFESLVAGADGWIAGLVCAFPRETVAIYNWVQRGEIDKARKLYRWFMPLLELDIHPKLVQYIKLAEVATGLGTETVRPPRLPLTGEERKRIQAIIDSALAIRPNLSE